jgi:hypothetical protein
MASTKTIVRLLGILRGSGLEATCTVEATKVTESGGGLFQHTNFKVANVSKTLPEGEYQLIVDGLTIAVRYMNDDWLAG